MSVKNVMRVLAGTAGVMLVAGAAGPGAAAVSTEDSGDVQAVVRKTVRQAGSATGEISNSTMYTQISAVGNGTKTVTVPVGTTSNRNLNAFGPFPMEGESMVVELTVADGGGVEQRTVTDADINPMAVSVKVMLDGTEIAPGDLVGANGVVDVEYTVRNTTAKSVPVTFTDVNDKEITEDVDTADPFVGSLDVVLPQGFNEVTAPGATVAGNGQNETQIGYTFVLFPPLGSAEVKVGYQARISNGQMPAAEFSFLPIVPFDNSTIAGTAEAWKGGAATGASIYGAGTQIGDNLLKLQEGAGQLVAGLGQLSAGASELSDGLVNTAAPGSAALADGANQVSDGLDQLNSSVPALEEGVSDLNDGAAQLNDGAEQVADGNAELSDGLNELNSNVPALATGVTQLNGGATQVADGMAKLQAGIDTLSKGVAALPTTIKDNPGYKQLQGALAGVQAAIGSRPAGPVANPRTLNEAITNLEFALDNDFKNGLASIKGAVGLTPEGAVPTLPYGGIQTNVNTLLADLVCSDPALGCTAVQAPADPVDVRDRLVNINQTIGADAAAGTVLNGLTKLIAGIGQPTDFPATPGTLYFGLEGIRAGLTNPNCSLQDPQNPQNPCGIKEIQGLVSAGIDALVAGISAELLKGIGTTPVNPATCSPTTLTCASAQLNAGTKQLAAGTSALNSQVPTLASGISQLAAGGNKLADGSAQVADGTETLAAGTETLNSNVPTLASGVEQLDDGAAQVADGADQLAAGLGAAADGSGQLADGLAQAEPGGAQIEDGAGRLKEEGADVLADTGKEAQLGFAKDVALLEASQQAGLEGAGIPFGPAEGTDVVTTAAYKMYLSGMAADTDNNALKFGLGALLIAGAGGVAFAAARKLAA